MQKILVIRFSSIGDIVLTSPLLRAIKQQKPETELHYLSKKQFTSVLEHNPHIDRLFLFQDNLEEIIQQLKKEKYDWVVDLHHNLRSFRIKRALNTPNSTFDKLNFEKWLLVRLKINQLPKKHIVQRYFKALKPLGINDDHLGLEYYSGLEKQEEIEGLPFEIERNFAALVIGGTYFTKQIPLAKLLEMVEAIAIPIVVLGGPNDQVIANELAEKANKPIYVAVGKSSLNESAEIIRRSRFVVTGDTGLMHIAAAFQRKIFSVWGNTVPEFGMYPYLPQNPELSVILEDKNLSCRPCSKLGFQTCPKKHFDCMMKQDFSSLIQYIQSENITA